MSISELAVLWSVAVVAIILSINSRGPLRMSLSWFLTALILVMTIFVSSMKVANLKQQFVDGKAVDPSSLPTSSKETPPPDPRLQPSNIIQKEHQAITEYVLGAQQLVGSGLGLAGALITFDLGDMRNLSDSHYRKVKERATGFRTEASNLMRQANALQVPEKTRWLHKDVMKALELLRQSSYASYAFFNAEDADEENALIRQTHSQGRSAQNQLRLVQQELLRIQP